MIKTDDHDVAVSSLAALETQISKLSEQHTRLQDTRKDLITRLRTLADREHDQREGLEADVRRLTSEISEVHGDLCERRTEARALRLIVLRPKEAAWRKRYCGAMVEYAHALEKAVELQRGLFEIWAAAAQELGYNNKTLPNVHNNDYIGGHLNKVRMILAHEGEKQ
jgi:hypothetical protein